MKKYTLLLILIFTLLFSHAQKVSVTDLVGSWEAVDSSAKMPPLQFDFIDSMKVNISTMGVTTAKLNYRIESMGSVTKLYIQGKTEMGMKFNDVWLLKKMNGDTLKFQSQKVSSLTGDTDIQIKEWDTVENNHNTGLLVRKRAK